MRAIASRFIRVRSYAVCITLGCVVVLFCCGCKKNNPVATQTSELPVVVESLIPQCSSVGQVIVITGENFNPTANLNYVYFSGRAGGYVQGDIDSAVPVSNPTRLYVTIPPAVASGVVIVKVGDSMDSTKQVLRIMLAVSPVLKDYEPKEGNTGTPLTISGTGFDTVVQNISVRIGTVPASVTSVTSTQIHCTVPAGAAGGQITVLMDCDSIVLPGVFKVRPDSIVSFTPSQGPIDAQVTVTTNFLIDTTDKVYFGNIQAQILSTSGTQIATKVPANAVTAPITISYPYGGATSTAPFTVTKRNPKITSILPISGHAGTIVTITGTNFNPDTAGLMVTFGALQAKVLSVTSTQITAVAPAGVVTAPISISIFGETATSQVMFTVTAPGIARFTPLKGLPGDTVTITSIVELDSTVTVEFGNIPAQVLSVVHNVVTVVLPKGAITAPITLNFYGLSASSASNFIVVSPAILSFMPTESFRGHRVTIATNFSPTLNGLIAKFGNVQATIDSLEDSAIVVTVPQGAVTAPINVTWNGQTIRSNLEFVVDTMSTMSVQLRNLIATVENDITDSWGPGPNDNASRKDTTNENFNVSFPDSTCLSGSIETHSQKGDTSVYSDAAYTVTLTLEAVLDTVQSKFTYVSVSLNQTLTACPDFNGNSVETLSYNIIFKNIPYTISTDGSYIGSIDGASSADAIAGISYSSWVAGVPMGNNTFEERTRYIMSMKSTGNSYIRITLTP